MKLLIVILSIITFFSCNTTEKRFTGRDGKSDTLRLEQKAFNLKMLEYYKEEYLQKVLSNEHHNYKPEAGVIPDSITAVSIAEILLVKIYGREQINEEMPLTALLKDGYWIVYGNFPYEPGAKGGVAEIVLKKDNGEVINISHGE